MPFRAAVDAGAAMVMSAHIALPGLEGDSTTPATLAPRIMSEVLRDSLGFRGLAITDAMTMEGVGKGYGVEESSVLSVKAGADIILKPGDVRRAVDAVVAAVARGEIPPSRIAESSRRVLELKARSGVAFQRFASLETLREVVGAPEHRAAANDIARRAITLLREREAVLPMAGRRTLVVQYMPETELRAGRVFAAAIRAKNPDAHVVKIGPAVSAGLLDSIAVMAQEAERVVVAAHVRRIEGEGRPAIPPQVAAWMERLATEDALAPSGRLAMVAFGSPYVIRQVPSVQTYLVTFGVGDALEEAAAQAVLGHRPIGGVSPVSLPGFFARGDGIRRPAVSAPPGAGSAAGPRK
jgi:beta-N-acetylhexosaminidase